ncbi:hypothetical protein A2239_03425 [Candidatus Uhrbacteria bacterium RIFOXYA2_FULL_40_9]|nr:MAG: hypothetical protein UT94_C0029G0004 [Candidatus Uhrbacteria bacterium GW2011_GWF2_40_263]OGL92786.1 MAG: hypothetical protein A2239_03425 [Candidatus Uhrbacteria bacterium RIFOXYA2_FULL_40_9]OGL97615.1 MAG: hypothetical protein A2332_01740 [Candidatus Uhrbacteria bacterium RIFOXYB2_FULL_41_18]HBK34385.1 hypothetical protein [Candidatus Uhrbacteria bacterium]HCB56065.1 hypothetical protein [Candidatus Uhrbacteria bacterium]
MAISHKEDPSDNLLVSHPQIVDLKYTKPRTIILIPSISFGELLMSFYKGIQNYEERYLYFLFYLKNPKTKLLVLLSEGYEKAIIEYFLEKVSQTLSLPEAELRSRFSIISVPKGEHHQTLTQCVLKNKQILSQLKNYISENDSCYFRFFRVTQDEYRLSQLLGIPYYGLSPHVFYVNEKEGARQLFKEAGVALPEGYEGIRDLKGAYETLKRLAKKTEKKKFMLKINNEGSGVGIIKMNLDKKDYLSSYQTFYKNLEINLPISKAVFARYFKKQGGIVEVFLEGEEVESPSAQFEVTPQGRAVNLATHLQDLEGNDYIGGYFPCPEVYREQVIKAGYKITRLIAKKGGRGRMAIDFLLIRNKSKWNLYGIEINARKGGTNHPYFWAKYLTEADYQEKKGILKNTKGEVRYYATEQGGRSEKLKKISARTLIQKMQEQKIDFDPKKKEGIFLHMLSTMKPFGKVGLTIIGPNQKKITLYRKKFTQLVDSL